MRRASGSKRRGKPGGGRGGEGGRGSLSAHVWGCEALFADRVPLPRKPPGFCDVHEGGVKRRGLMRAWTSTSCPQRPRRNPHERSGSPVTAPSCAAHFRPRQENGADRLGDGLLEGGVLALKGGALRVTLGGDGGTVLIHAGQLRAQQRHTHLALREASLEEMNRQRGQEGNPYW